MGFRIGARLALLVLAAGLSWQPAVRAEDGKVPPSVTAISPIFGQLVAFSQPSDFVVANEKADGSRYIRDAVPKDETVDDWSQMITVTGAKELALNRNVTTIQVASTIANGFQKRCPKSFAATSFGNMDIDGYRAFAVVAGCGSVDTGNGKHAETALILAIQGGGDFYTLQWAERSAATDTPPEVEAPVWKERLERLGPIRLCPIIAGEGPPYPSCTERK
jgi:hypothetical protein